jgi:putative NIF3 family GTP cyclohydrolase 1 type 2
VLAAIKNDIAIYAIHTSLDNVQMGVNRMIANQLGLQGQSILSPKKQMLSKLYTYVPTTHAGVVRDSMFNAGAGNIGDYSECSFNTSGIGTFRPGKNTNPFIGQTGGKRENVDEIKLEVVFPSFLIHLENKYQEVGSGMVGFLPNSLGEYDFLALVKQAFGLKFLKHTALLGKPIQKIALCGGSGSFLLKNAIACGADAYITSDIKYHEFFDADKHLLLLDIGHWESEQFTIDLLQNYLQEIFPTFAVLKTAVNTNPVRYF